MCVCVLFEITAFSPGAASECCLVVVTRRLMAVDSDVINPNERQLRDKVCDWFRCAGVGVGLSALVIYRHTKK